MLGTELRKKQKKSSISQCLIQELVPCNQFKTVLPKRFPLTIFKYIPFILPRPDFILSCLHFSFWYMLMNRYTALAVKHVSFGIRDPRLKPYILPYRMPLEFRGIV